MEIVLSGPRLGDALDVIDGLTYNLKGKKLVSDFFMDNYDAVGPLPLSLIIKMSIVSDI